MDGTCSAHADWESNAENLLEILLESDKWEDLDLDESIILSGFLRNRLWWGGLDLSGPEQWRTVVNTVPPPPRKSAKFHDHISH